MQITQLGYRGVLNRGVSDALPQKNVICCRVLEERAQCIDVTTLFGSPNDKGEEAATTPKNIVRVSPCSVQSWHEYSC